VTAPATATRRTDPGVERPDLAGLAPGRPRLVELPVVTCLEVDGTGAPGEPAFTNAIRALYGLSYAIHFDLKQRVRINRRVMPLEALWWGANEGPFDAHDPESWHWTLMIPQPAEVTSLDFEAARDELERRHPEIDAAGVRLADFAEGLAAQVLHVGPYAAEAPTISLLHEFIRDSGLIPVGRHHEIYLGDPRRSAPERLRTLIRQPVGTPAGS
jgi:hypothetical protein